MIDNVPRAKAALPRPVGQRYRPLAGLRLKDLLVGFQRLARIAVGDLPPRSLSHSSKGSSKEANFFARPRGSSPSQRTTAISPEAGPETTPSPCVCDHVREERDDRQDTRHFHPPLLAASPSTTLLAPYRRALGAQLAVEPTYAARPTSSQDSR